MNKKLLEVLKNEKVQEEIKDLYCKLHKESFVEGSAMGSGWGWTIILELDGTVDYMYNSFNSTRMDVYEGKAIEIAGITDNAEVSYEDMGDIENVEDYAEFIKYLETLFDATADTEAEGYREEKAEYIEENANWSEYHEFNPDNFRAIELEAWEWNSDNYAYDQITDKLDSLIEDVEERMTYYNNFQQEF